MREDKRKVLLLVSEPDGQKWQENRAKWEAIGLALSIKNSLGDRGRSVKNDAAAAGAG
jgi:hypothetical protein